MNKHGRPKRQQKPKPKAFDRKSNSLRCYECGNDDPSRLRISNDVVNRRRTKRDGVPRTYKQVAIDCLKCGHQWYSTHKAAIKTSRTSDANLKKRHGGND